MAGRRLLASLVTSSLLLLPFVAFASTPLPARAAQAGRQSASLCPGVVWPAIASTQAGHPYLSVAYDALSQDRANYAGLGPLRQSPTLSAIAEAHSAYMASIGTWSDADPAGNILERVRAAGLGAIYAGQNVVVASGETVQDAIAQGEAFFAHEATTGGPHWDNITNPNHHFVGIGIALFGSPGNYNLYLTQVFSDAGICDGTSYSNTATVNAAAITPKVGSIVTPAVDPLNLRAEPAGQVIGTLRIGDKLKVYAVQGCWAQVKSAQTQLYGWVYIPLLSAS